ncbi:sigma-70 family RNA polymerase sigma factor [Sorangium sp. So ce861]|uniref:sigma-70 family RNA polymerase sigma factor n=1 Tax=Sorangium sp. So ce861 TaxID=3133323 RepID=UPI003F60006F
MDAKDPHIAPAGAPPPTWETVVREHLRYLRGCVASERIPTADREDVLQEVLHGISRGLATFDPARGELRAWLKAIVHNHAAMYRRRAYRRREAPWPDEPLELADEAPSSEERHIERERRQLLSKLLLELPPERREAVIAHELDEAGIGHVAERLSIPATTAKSRVRHGREELKAAARRWQARHHRRLAALLPMRAAGCSGERARRAASREHALHPLHRAGRALRHAISGATAPRPRTVALTCASLAVGAFGVVLTAGVLLVGHSSALPGGAAPPAPSIAAHPRAASATAPADEEASEPSYLALNDDAPSRRAMFPARTGDSAPARPGPLPRRPQRRPGAQDDDLERLRMAAAARAIGHDALARALMERRRHDLPGIAPAPDRDVSPASSTPAARSR